MKKFEEPVMEILCFSIEDVVTTSNITNRFELPLTGFDTLNEEEN